MVKVAKRAIVLFSQAHEEDFPEKFANKLPGVGILYETSYQQLTLEVLNKYTCIAFINPKVPISPQEKEAINKYKEEDGGIFFTFNILNESQYEKQKMNIDFISQMLGVKLIATRFLPKVKIGDYEIEYTRRELKKDWLGRRVAVFHKEDKIKCKKTIEIAGSIDRKIKYIPQLIFQEINEEFENLEVDESSADFVSAFLECEDSRVILKRDVELYNEMFYKMLWSDYYYHGNDYFISDPSELDNEVMAFFKKYENVGVIGDLSAPGRIFCMCTNKLFDEIENEGRYAKLSQKLLQTLLIWVSEPRKNKLTLRTDENLRTIKMFEEIQPKISREIEEKYRDVINKLKQKLIY